jgi:hypothetical protein
MPYAADTPPATEYRPAAGAVGPPARRSPPAKMRAIAPTGSASRCTSSNVPDDVAHHVVQVRVRRDLHPYSIAVARTSMRSTRRLGDFDWHSTERKAEKSCSPISACAALCMASGVERAMDPRAAQPLQMRSARCDSECSSDRCGAGRCAGHESPSVTSAAHCSAMVGGSLVLAPSTHARGVRTASVSKWMTWPVA